MKINRVRAIVTSPGRNLMTLKTEADAGSCGIGGAILNSREKAVASVPTEIK